MREVPRRAEDGPERKAGAGGRPDVPGPGDGVRDLQGPRTDTCDDGNGSNADDCVDLLGQCRPATCGDGFIDSQGPVTEVATATRSPSISM